MISSIRWIGSVLGRLSFPRAQVSLFFCKEYSWPWTLFLSSGGCICGIYNELKVFGYKDRSPIFESITTHSIFCHLNFEQTDTWLDLNPLKETKKCLRWRNLVELSIMFLKCIKEVIYLSFAGVSTVTQHSIEGK